MTNTKNLWVHSLIALLLCISLLIGTTFAWFTDSVTSSSNVITSGNLDLEMYWTEDLSGGVWHNVEDDAYNTIFNYDNWEPGYTEVRYIKLVNAGSLGFNYQLSITPQGTVGKLAEVIGVYYATDGTEVADRSGLSNLTYAGFLNDLADGGTAARGTLLAAGETSVSHASGEVIVTLAMSMLTTAGNEYQNGSVGDGFTVTALATQCMYENDSYGDDYDQDAEYPTVLKPGQASAAVTPENGKVPTGGVTVSGDGISASLPEGVALEDGATEVTLKVTPMEETTSNITVVDDEILIPVDIHIDGVSETNTTPIVIELGEILPKYLNMGNYTLIHVENGTNVPMTMVSDAAALTEHNQFCYDPYTGNVTVSMATFSEVALIADTENVWQGKRDESWGLDGEYTIATADELAQFGKMVGGGEPFDGKTVTLVSDLKFSGEGETDGSKIFYPIGYSMDDGKVTIRPFKGDFDGAGHTISGIFQNTWIMTGDYSGTYYNDAMGLFGYISDGTVKNLTIDRFYSEGEFAPTGCVTAYADGICEFENIAITNSHPQTYNTGVAGIIGWDNEDHSEYTFKNITVDDTNTISALWGSWDVAAAGMMGYLSENSKATFENCNVSATIDVYNDVCGNYQYYWYRYCGAFIGTVDKRHDNGKGALDLNNITATNCTVNFGDRHEYYYCEFEENTQASYTEDYQFSRVPNSQIDISAGKEKAKCIDHNHTPAENNQAVYLPFRQLFGGYGWGVDGVDLGEYEGIEISVVTEGQQKFVSKFIGDFLYRVGNQNTVSVGSLFEVGKEPINDSGVYVTIDKVDENANVSGTFTANKDDWTKGTIQFSGTGVVKITIQDYDFCTPTVLYLEVVDAYNRTTASFSGNSVLLNDVYTSSTLSTSGVIYGNGFTVNMEDAPISEKNGAVFHLYDGAVLKHLNIVGKEFTTVAMNVNDTNYGVSAVRAWGTVVIENCYISGCRSAVSVTGTELTMKDSVIANGIYANIDFRSGILNLHNVTTVNEPHTVNGTTVVGLGIVGNMTASAGRQVNITGTLTQYNWVSKADCANIKASGVDGIFNSVFTDDKYAELRYTYEGTTYVNTGILSLCTDFGKDAVTGYPSSYDGMDVTATISNVTVDGYVWSAAQQGTLSADDMKYHDSIYIPSFDEDNQGTAYIPPAFNFAGTDLTVENGMVQISYESGSSYTLSNETLELVFTAEKYGQTLPYTISMNGTDYTNQDIVFNAAASQTYTITYTITDNLIFDREGKKTDKTYEVKKELKVFATVVDKSADAPTFTFYYGTNGSASAGTPHTTQPTNSYASAIKKVNDTYYIMPNVSATTANAIGEKTVGSEKVYYPIVDGINVRSGNSTDYDFTRYYPVFKAVKISDNGTEYSYSGTKEMPETVSWAEAEIDSGNGASSLNDGFGLYNNQYLCKIQKKAGDAESGGTSVVKFSYTALDGNTYHYYVGYRFYDEDEGSLCVTADTPVTLADGSQKRIDQVTYEDQLLVWDFQNGKYAAASPAIIFEHGYDYNTVIKLNFSDGTTLKAVNLHQLFDADLNSFVSISADTVQEYVGHAFVKRNLNGYTEVTLVDFEISEEYEAGYGVISAEHYNILVADMFSTDFKEEDFPLFNYFAVGQDMKFDEEQMSADIEKYGLYTYADFADYLTEAQFDAFNVRYFKIPVGKGMYSYDGIRAMIAEYLK